MYTLLYLKWTNSKDLCVAHGTLLNVTCQSGWEGCLRENGYMHMHGWDPSCSLETTSTLFIGIPQYKMFLLLKKNCISHLLSGNPRPSTIFPAPPPPRAAPSSQSHPLREQACGNRQQAGMVSSDNMGLKLNLPQELQMMEGGKKKSQTITKNLLYDPPTSASLSVVIVQSLSHV